MDVSPAILYIHTRFSPELFQPKIFCHNQNFLAILIGAHNLSTFPDDKDTKIRIEQAKQVIRIADNVPCLDPDTPPLADSLN